LKLNANGSLAWGTNLEGVQVSVIHFGPAGTILLSGLRPLSATASEFVLARVNPATGALENQATMVAGKLTSGMIIGSSSTGVYWAMQAANGGNFNTQTGYVGWVNLTLDQPVTQRYTTPVTFAAAGCNPSNQGVLYSPFLESSNSVGAIALDANLMALQDCGLFANAFPHHRTTELTTSPLALTVSDASVTARSAQSALSTSLFAPTALTLHRAGLCAGGDPNPPLLRLTSNGASGYSLTFPSQAGVTCEIQSTDDLNDPFATISTRSVTGGTITHQIPRRHRGQWFLPGPGRRDQSTVAESAGAGRKAPRAAVRNFHKLADRSKRRPTPTG
jgi:hypothetical protein